MFSMCSKLTPRAPIPNGRMAQFMQPWVTSRRGCSIALRALLVTLFFRNSVYKRPNLPTCLSGGNSCICEHGKVEGRILGSIIGLQLKKPARKRRKARSGCERWIFGLETRRNIEVNYQTRWRNWAKASSGQSRRSPWGFSRQNWQQRLTCWPTDPIAFGLKSKS